MTRRNGIYQPKSPTHNSLLLDCCERVKKRFLIRRRKSLLDCARIKTLLEHPLNLPVDNNKEYQKAQGDVLDTVVQLLARLSSFDDDIASSYLEPKACLMRINRDIRFSKDKTPYKTNFFAFINKGGRKSPYAGYYLHVEPGASFAGGGIYMPEPAILEHVRGEIDRFFKEWQSIVQGKELLHFFPEGVQPSGKLVRPPKGYDISNPAIDYLKFKGYFTQRFLDNNLTVCIARSSSTREFCRLNVQLICSSIFFAIWFFGKAPSIWSTTWPFLKTSREGMLLIPYCAAVVGFSSTLSFAITARPS